MCKWLGGWEGTWGGGRHPKRPRRTPEGEEHARRVIWDAGKQGVSGGSAKVLGRDGTLLTERHRLRCLVTFWSLSKLLTALSETRHSTLSDPTQQPPNRSTYPQTRAVWTGVWQTSG